MTRGARQFQVYNLVLRRFPADRYEALRSGGNVYTTTLYLLVSCVVCISRETRLPAGAKLYRGLGGDKTLPAFFFKSDGKGRKGMLEWGYMSTTADKAVAVQYCGVREGKPFPTILEIDAGAVDRGADISDLSQYPGQPLTLLFHVSFSPSSIRASAPHSPSAQASITAPPLHTNNTPTSAAVGHCLFLATATAPASCSSGAHLRMVQVPSG